MAKQKIIIVGYPKSGNTWITRLVAELVQCPVVGFLYSDLFETAIEGLDRQSEYECYKSHHQWHELNDEDKQNAKIIYVLRDPRDISISGRPYFFAWQSLIETGKNTLPIRLINWLYRATPFADAKAQQLMNKAIFYGEEKVHQWCKVSWNDHLTPYLEKDNVLKIKYEDLLDDTFNGSKNILNFIGIKKNEEEIKEAIEYQSFYKASKRHKKHNSDMASHFGQGKKEQWRIQMKNSEINEFASNLGDTLKTLNYPEK
ncbi:MAG: hypothetical protein HKN75_02835 [Bacteroidia bacterium]|nr:hypothetical protein [Bacteroidia bacterium]